jgi:Zn-dependent protease
MSRRRFDFGRVEQYYFPHVETLQTVLFVAPVLLFSVVAHEYAHGYAALRQGDTTARDLGRLTWNPAKHIDPFLTVIMPLLMGLASNWRVIIGGAKPVPVNPANYRHYVRGDIIVSLAGVATNLVLAVAFTGLIAASGLLARVAPGTGGAVGLLQAVAYYGITLNLVLVLFNLIPIPPLDGSHVVKHLLPASWQAGYQRIGQFGLLILVALLYFGGGVLNAWMTPAFALQLMLLKSVSGFIHPSLGDWLQ